MIRPIDADSSMFSKEGSTLAIGREFGQQETEVLLQDGALIYPSTGLSMFAQYKQGFPIDETWYQYVGIAKIAAVRSQVTQIALYPDPDKFYIPNSENKTLTEQELLAEQESALLRQRLGVDGLIIPIPANSATLTEIISRHQMATGEILLGKKYGFKTIRTSQLLPEEKVTVINGGVMSLGPNPYAATVRAYAMGKPDICVSSYMHESSASNILAARWIFPRKN